MKMNRPVVTAIALSILLVISGCATGPSRDQLEQERTAQAQQAKRQADDEAAKRAGDEPANQQAALNSAKRIRSFQAVLAAIDNDVTRIESTENFPYGQFTPENLLSVIGDTVPQTTYSSPQHGTINTYYMRTSSNAKKLAGTDKLEYIVLDGKGFGIADYRGMRDQTFLSEFKAKNGGGPQMAFVGFGMIVYSNASYTRVFVPKRIKECIERGNY